MRRYIIVALVLCVLVGVACAWPASMGSWDYRKSVTINNTGANLTNYQLMFTVNRSAGSDSSFTVFLDGKCAEDYDDIRFTTSDEETLCDYWIESSSSTVASIWVEVPSIVNSTAYGSTTLYLYYGNSGASAVSDGDDTFPFFDDFPGSSLDGAKWTTGGSPTISVSGGEVTISGGGSAYRGILSSGTHETNTTLRGRYKRTGTGTHYEYTGFETTIDLSGANEIYHNDIFGANYLYTKASGTGSGSGSLGASDEDYHIWDFIRNSTTNVIFNRDGGNLFTKATNVPSASLNVIFVEYNGALVVDWVLIRKYAATEPTVSAWGSEETGTLVALYPSFSAVPLSGYVPLLVSFSDASTTENATISAWQWSFGDSTANSTQQNPQHQYTTSGLYDVILTITNTSLSLTNSTAKTDYINVTVNPDAPNADFSVTETCGNIGDTFYFIDFSTGSGLYAWNWSFGDGGYSELRNPTHQYAANGTYSVNLTVWGAYGSDSLLRTNLITIPCGAPTPTPTVTPTGTGNVTEGNATYIYAPDQDYVPFPIWLAIVIVTIALFGHSLIFLKNSDLTAIMASLFAMLSAWLSNMIGYIDVQVTSYAEEIVISPVVQAVHPPWLVYTMLIFAFVSVVNIFAAIYKVYLKPVPWNEIYDRKLPKWGRRK